MSMANLQPTSMGRVKDKKFLVMSSRGFRAGTYNSPHQGKKTPTSGKWALAGD